MELVLVVGDIQLQFTEFDEEDYEKKWELERQLGIPIREYKNYPCPDKHLILQPPGFHFLKTCKQACAEGFKMFFSRNNFFSPMWSD